MDGGLRGVQLSLAGKAQTMTGPVWECAPMVWTTIQEPFPDHLAMVTKGRTRVLIPPPSNRASSVRATRGSVPPTTGRPQHLR